MTMNKLALTLSTVLLLSGSVALAQTAAPTAGAPIPCRALAKPPCSGWSVAQPPCVPSRSGWPRLHAPWPRCS